MVAAISVITGINMVKGPNTYKFTPAPSPSFEAKEAAIQTTVPDNEEKYKIVLEDNCLILYEGKKKLNETEIAPDVLPFSDIKALESGLSYSSLENALVDWESLCK